MNLIIPIILVPIGLIIFRTLKLRGIKKDKLSYYLSNYFRKDLIYSVITMLVIYLFSTGEYKMLSGILLPILFILWQWFQLKGKEHKKFSRMMKVILLGYGVIILLALIFIVWFVMTKK